MPDLLNAWISGGQAGREARQSRNAFADQTELRRLASGAISGDPEALTQAAAIDPKTATQYDDVGATIARQAANAANYMLEGVRKLTPEQVNSGVVPPELQARYQQIIPLMNMMAKKQGKTAPSAFDMASIPTLEHVVAMAQGRGGSGTGGQVQSTKIGADGFYYTVDRAGNWTNSGIKADPNVQVRDQAGLPLGLIDKRAGTIRGIGEAGEAPMQGSPQAAAPLPQGSTQQITDAIAASANELLKRGVPEAEIEAWMLQQQGAEGAVDGIASPVNTGVGAMRPAMSPAQTAANQRADAATVLAREAADRAARMEGVGTGYKSDGQGGQTFVPGGPADPAVIARNKAAGSNGAGGKALPANVVTKLTKQSGIYDNTEALIGTFDDEYAGNVMTGRTENVLGQLGLPGATEGQSDWWQQYDRQKNEVRNLLFGSALTPGEQAAFEAADIRPNMAPARIRANLKMQADIIAKGLEKQARVWKAQGYNAEAIDAATSIGTLQESPEQSGWGIQRVGD